MSYLSFKNQKLIKWYYILHQVTKEKTHLKKECTLKYDIFDSARSNTTHFCEQIN